MSVAGVRNRESFGTVAGPYRVLAGDTGLITLVPAPLLSTIFVQKIHIQITTPSVGELWTFQDGAGIPLVPAVSAGAIAHFDFNFGPDGVPCSAATAFVLNITGATGAVGWITWSAYQTRSGADAKGSSGGGGSAYAAAVKADGATHHWRLGEASGTVAADSIGTAPGTISGGVTLAQPGALADGDTAMSFNGTTGQVMTAASVALGPVWTIEAWIRPTVAGYGMAAGIVGDSGKDEWAMGTADLSGTTVAMFAFRYGGGGGGSLQNPTGVLTLNAWHHLVATWAAPDMALFLDGVLSQPMTFIPGPTAIAGRVSIGQIPPPAYWAMKFTGGVDEVAIYPTALTPAQVLAHFQAASRP